MLPSNSVISHKTMSFTKSLAFALAAVLLTTPSTYAANIVIGIDATQTFEAGWADGICYAPIPNVRIGDTLDFYYEAHNVYRMPNLEAFMDCDFTDAIELSGVESYSYRHEITREDVEGGISGTGGSVSLFFACQRFGHCYGDQRVRVDVDVNAEPADGGRNPQSRFAIGVGTEICASIQNGDTDISEVLTSADDTDTSCSEPIVSIDYSISPPRTYHTTTCLSKPFTMTPGGVINRASFVHFPYPIDRRVLLGNRVWEFVDDNGSGTLTPVNVNQLYVHHFLGSVVRGSGAESTHRIDNDAPFPPPYGILTGDFDNVMTFHLIDLRDTGDRWLECAECRCQEEFEFRDEGGIYCCTNCTSLTGPTVDYRMRYNVSWTELEDLEEPAKPITIISADIARGVGKVIEFDVPHYSELPEEQRLIDNPTVMVIERVGTIQSLFSYGNVIPTAESVDGTASVKIHRCTGHLHIGGLSIRLEDAATKEIICSCDATYGTDPGANLGFLTSIGVINFDNEDGPKIVPTDRELRFVAHYNASEIHVGVMGLFQLFISDERGSLTVGPREASLTVDDVCAAPSCDPSLLPEWCVDNLESSDLCQFLEPCTCDTFLALPSSIVTGCGGVLRVPGSDIEIPVDYFCHRTCGCDGEDEEMVREGFEVQLDLAIEDKCRYNTEECRRYLSNLHGCSMGMTGIEGVDSQVVRDMVRAHGSRLAIESAKLGDPYMHRSLPSSSRASGSVSPCGGDDGSSAGYRGRKTPYVLLIGVALHFVAAASFCFL